jgi:TPR repeat protein
MRKTILILLPGLLLGLALAASALAQSPTVQSTSGTPLTTLCIGLPECEPGGSPAPPPAPDPVAPARVAQQAGDWALARQLLTPLAEVGNPEAQYRLGDLCYKAQGGPQDDAAARGWYAKAAEQLDSEWAAEAQVNLGIIYGLGRGVPKDGVAALMWMEIAAANGSDLAQQDRALFAARLKPEEAEKARAQAREWLRARGR